MFVVAYGLFSLKIKRARLAFTFVCVGRLVGVYYLGMSWLLFKYRLYWVILQLWFELLFFGVTKMAISKNTFTDFYPSFIFIKLHHNDLNNVKYHLKKYWLLRPFAFIFSLFKAVTFSIPYAERKNKGVTFGPNGFLCITALLCMKSRCTWSLNSISQVIVCRPVNTLAMELVSTP